jgi:hypothetical protein
MVAFQAVDPGSTPGRRTFFQTDSYFVQLVIRNQKILFRDGEFMKMLLICDGQHILKSFSIYKIESGICNSVKQIGINQVLHKR